MALDLASSAEPKCDNPLLDVSAQDYRHVRHHPSTLMIETTVYRLPSLLRTHS